MSGSNCYWCARPLGKGHDPGCPGLDNPPSHRPVKPEPRLVVGVDFGVAGSEVTATHVWDGVVHCEVAGLGEEGGFGLRSLGDGQGAMEPGYFDDPDGYWQDFEDAFRASRSLPEPKPLPAVKWFTGTRNRGDA